MRRCTKIGRPFLGKAMRSILIALTVGLSVTVGTQALADGALVKSCVWSSAGLCPVNLVKGADYLFRPLTTGSCGDGSVAEVVNPIGQVNLTLTFDGDCTASGGGIEARSG